MSGQERARRGADVALGLGSNQGDRATALGWAVERLSRLVADLRCSAVYETEPVGREAQPAFLNLCCVGRTTLGPGELLERLLALEEEAGRERPARGDGSAGAAACAGRDGPRPLDLDLLLYAEERREQPCLTVPHPRLHRRAFVLVPLAEVAGGWRHPVLGRTVAELADEVGAEGVRPYEGPLPDSLRRCIDPGGG